MITTIKLISKELFLEHKRTRNGFCGFRAIAEIFFRVLGVLWTLWLNVVINGRFDLELFQGKDGVLDYFHDFGREDAQLQRANHRDDDGGYN